MPISSTSCLWRSMASAPVGILPGGAILGGAVLWGGEPWIGAPDREGFGGAITWGNAAEADDDLDFTAQLTSTKLPVPCGWMVMSRSHSTVSPRITDPMPSGFGRNGNCWPSKRLR